MNNNYLKALVLGLAVALGAFLASPAQADLYKGVVISEDWEIAAPGANTDVITDVTWGSNYPLRLTIQCDTSTIVNVMVTRDATENALGMNSNTALVAGATYVFDVPGVQFGDTVNVQVETDSAIPMLAIGEVRNSQR